jgi:hypothetical protein
VEAPAHLRPRLVLSLHLSLVRFRSRAGLLTFLGTVINADEASTWDALHKRYEMRRINHEEAYSFDGAGLVQALLVVADRRLDLGELALSVVTVRISAMMT